MLKIRRPLGRLIFNMGIVIPGKTVFLIETAPWNSQSGLCFNIKTVFWYMEILIIKIRWSWDHIIFIMEIPIFVRQHRYIETVPCFYWPLTNRVGIGVGIAISVCPWVHSFIHLIHLHISHQTADRIDLKLSGCVHYGSLQAWLRFGLASLDPTLISPSPISRPWQGTFIYWCLIIHGT